jgi:hypothetical protein
MKIRYALPLVQMLLAATLLWWDHLLSRVGDRACDMAGPTPAFSLLIAINMPVSLPRMAWYRHVPYPLEDFILIAAVGLFWYWVALNIPSWRRTGFSSWWRPVQLVVDLAIVALGVVSGLYGVGKEYDGSRSFTYGVGCFGPNLWFRFLPLILIGCFYLAWSLVLIFFFGRDFIHALRRAPA